MRRPTPAADRPTRRLVAGLTLTLGTVLSVGLAAPAVATPAVAAPAVAAPAVAASTTSTRAYPAANRRAFVDACVQSARASSKVTLRLATDYCGCLLTQYEARYTFAEFTALDRAITKGKRLSSVHTAFATLASDRCASTLR